MRKDERGVGLVIEVVLVAILLAVVGAVGYRVMKSGEDKDAKTTTAQNAQSADDGEQAKVWTEGDFAVEGTYADADVVDLGGGLWRMYYAIQPEVQNNQFEVYSSTSRDGTTWTREDGTRKTRATFPDVVKTPDGLWRMYFQSAGVIKSATSTDGLSFTDDAGTRIDTANDQGLTFDNVAAPTVYVKDDGTYLMVYRGTINTRYAANTPNAVTQLLMWATSTDGLAFTKKGIAVDSRNETLMGQLDGPELVMWDDSKLHVFATNYDGVFEFVFDGSSFQKGTLAYTLAPAQPVQPTPGSPVKPADVAPPGDPTLAKIDGVWHMYYGGSRAKNGIRYATLN